MFRRRASWSALLLAFAASSDTRGADDLPAFLGEMLNRRIISPDLGLAEVRLFAEAKVPRMPAVRDLADWERLAERMRSDTLRKVVYRGEAARWREAPTRVDWQETIDGGPGYRIRKLRYEAVPGFWVPALLYLPEKLEGKVPAVLNFDGHDPKGMFADYKQVRCINIAKRGMIALNVDWIGMGQLKSDDNRHTLQAHLDLCGTSGLAVFYSLQARGVDVLAAHEDVHPAKIAATGLSGGGWQTIFLGAMDPRVALIAPVAGYSSFLTRSRHASDLGDAEQTPVDLATVTDYALMTAMLAPRPALLTFNAKDDCCFAADHALAPLLEAAAPIYRLHGKEANLRSHVNQDPGTHNYLKDNRQALYRMLGDHFFPDRADYPVDEIPSDPEIKSVEQLRVAMPPDQATLRSLAMTLSRDLPRDRASPLPIDKAAAIAWQASRRARLAEVVRFQAYPIRAEALGSETKHETTASLWKLRAGDHWTIPAVELARSGSNGTTILIADAGRKDTRAIAEELLARGRRVLAIDPFDVGESKIVEKDWLWNLFISAVGDRPTGIRAAQLAAVARWSGSRGQGPISILAIGPSASTSALIAAALEPDSIESLELRGAPATFKEPIEMGIGIDQSPDRFCFGLLELTDISRLVALVTPRRVLFTDPSPRLRDELAPLQGWYATFGVEYLPRP